MDLPILAQGLPAIRRAGLPASGWFTRLPSGGPVRRPSGWFDPKFTGYKITVSRPRTEN